MKASAYALEWQRKNKEKVRAHKLAWYYKNRLRINTLYSKGEYVACPSEVKNPY